MLVLTRRVGEKIVIGQNIIVTVNRVCGGRVMVGVEAPKDVDVKRAELVEERKVKAA